MDQDTLYTEALGKLITEVTKYKESLDKNKTILESAADVCDATMGSDEISKGHIKRLKKALEQLKKTSTLAGEVATALIIEKREAEEIAKKAQEGV